MIDNIKEIIANKSRDLFNTYGYQKVSLRQIAAACDISVGNLTYYYPRKEDLLMLEHDAILNAFLQRVLSDEYDLRGLTGFFTVECAFLHRILRDPPIARLYAQVINVPSLRTRYCRAHHALYQHFFPETLDYGPDWNATVAMAGLEYELTDEEILINDFENTMSNIFQARMLFSGMDPDACADDIHTGVSEGIQLSLDLDDVFATHK